MEVYKDLFLYGSGVYERTYQVSGQVLGHHSAKVLGWGTDNDIDYWVRSYLKSSNFHHHCAAHKTRLLQSF